MTDLATITSVIAAGAGVLTVLSILVGIGLLRSLPVANSKAIDELRAIVSEQAKILNEMGRDTIHTEKRLVEFKADLEKLDKRLVALSERVRDVEIDRGRKQ